MHNDLVSKMILSGRKADHGMQYIDTEAEKIREDIKQSEGEDIEDIEDIEEATNKYLAQVRAKHG